MNKKIELGKAALFTLPSVSARSIARACSEEKRVNGGDPSNGRGVRNNGQKTLSLAAAVGPLLKKKTKKYCRVLFCLFVSFFLLRPADWQVFFVCFFFGAPLENQSWNSLRAGSSIVVTDDQKRFIKKKNKRQSSF